MKKAVIFWILALSGIVADVKLAVAANMSYAMPSLIKAFEHTFPSAKITYSIGSSGKLTAQILHGAPYDLFFSADMKYPQALYDANMTLGKPLIYAQGALALLSGTPREFKDWIKLLTGKSIRKIAIANPKSAPYGAAAKEALEQVNLYVLLKKKFVYGESVSQTVTYATKAADIGIVAASSLYAPQMKGYKKGVHWQKIASDLYTPIDQGMVLLGHAKGNADAQAFYRFMQSSEAKKILYRYGYGVR